MKKSKEEAIYLSSYLKGYADAHQNEKMSLASDYLKNMANHICGQGLFCDGGPECSSDHK